MKDYMTKDTQTRERTFADRRAFVLSETAMQTATQLVAEHAGAAPAAPDTSAVVNPNWQRDRERAGLREQAQANRRTGFLRVLGELTYRALPLDEHEKAPHRGGVLAETAELAEALLSEWSLSAAGEELLATASIVAQDAEDPLAAVTESVQSGELGPMVEHIAGEVEQRVLSAIIADRNRADATERRLAEATGTPSGDPELDALRARRAAKGSAPSLLEAIFIANRRALSEATGGEVSPEVLMAEAVCQYTLAEAMAAVGVLVIEKADVADLARRLSARKA